MRAGTLLAVVLALLVVPAAPAVSQTDSQASVEISLPTLADPVPPTGPQNSSATVRYQWSDGVAQDNVTVELSYEDGPEWLESSFTPSTVSFEQPTEDTDGVETEIVNVTLDVAKNATAYDEAAPTYSATAESSGTLPAASSEAEFPFVVGFAGNLRAELPEGGNVTAWGGLETQVPIDLENTANGPVSVDVRVAREPADARLNVTETVPLGFEPGNRTRTTHVDVRVPWTVSLEGPVEVDLSAEHADRGTPLAERTVGFQLEGNSAVPIPGPGPGIALAAVGLALLVRRSRRR